MAPSRQTPYACGSMPDQTLPVELLKGAGQGFLLVPVANAHEKRRGSSLAALRSVRLLKMHL